MLAFLYFVLYFVFYAFCGWLWEFLFNLIAYRRFHWHGFLTLPILPIYGFSAIGILLLVHPYTDNPFYVFVLAALLVSLLEFVTSYVLEKVFHLTLWDYSEWPFNYDGRISLFSSLGFGVMGLFLLYVVQPSLHSVITGIPVNLVYIIGWAFIVMILIDFGNSISSIIGVRLQKAQRDGTLDDIQDAMNETWKNVDGARKSAQKAYMKWQNYNLNRLRNAFPGARIITPASKKKSK